MNNQKIGLIILDGWGIGNGSVSDAIHAANTPVMDGLLQTYPNARLTTCGEAVGLPDGQMGNSEVGHMNIGAGRIVYQQLTRINKSIRDGEFKENLVLKKAFSEVKASGKKLHLFGLVSEGGVHSSQAHLHALLEMAAEYGIENTMVHAFTDGRDCDPKSGAEFIEALERKIETTTGHLASIIGRYYSMDRDNRWERIQKAYNLMVHGEGRTFSNGRDALLASYTEDITDEFLEAHVNPSVNGKIEEGDTILCFNFRTDRPREIVEALTQKVFHEYNMSPVPVNLITMTSYDARFKKVKVVFEKDNLDKTLGEVLSKMDRTQIRIAETEKYPHVTFFFSGGKETEFKGESRILVKSPKIATYDLQPEMSAIEVKENILEAMKKKKPDFFCLNFANPDMVGHTGVYPAIVKAVETVDQCLGEIVELAKTLNYELLVIADHGNADLAINPDGTPNTAHTLNPVPVVLITNNPHVELVDGILADVAPTILSRMGIASPLEMTGKSLASIN